MSNSITALLAAGLLGFFLGLVGAAGHSLEWLSESKQKNRERLVRIYSQVSIGESAASVAEKIVTGVQSESIFTDAEVDSAKWYVKAPPEFLQTNWVLSLCFKHGTLEGARFGSADDVDVVPKGAPSPKGTCQ